MNKVIIGIIVALLVIIGGYYAYTNGMFGMGGELMENEGVDMNTNESENGAMPMGKINIEEVCNGALAYMTFASGEDADAFVQACINGEHPEVIERFRAEMGVGDGAKI